MDVVGKKKKVQSIIKSYSGNNEFYQKSYSALYLISPV